ncbi:myb/SANT-like DNA-binding domain-containing protein 3 [Anoplophora glabripennis]|uniref:myb/SANT-like DNA-binding domain-containing protein 3 n=1 Tax=Anoplophora glabripennis TaxID=217634 RepID=UPI00087469C7|nr:myb/SANT-like DNA-binding domain-containing protein 3 [Anoplophora glabripennis]
MNKDKKRSVNFSAKEEGILISLIKKYRSVIECKLTDSINTTEKSNCWKRIETEFNAINCEIFRSQKVLHKKYDNIKKRAKKKFAEEECYMRTTGGGPPMDVKWTETENSIKEILGSRMEGFPSEFDYDCSNYVIDTSGAENGNMSHSRLSGVESKIDESECSKDFLTK